MRKKSDILKQIDTLSIKKRSIHDYLVRLIKKGFLDYPRKSKEIASKIQKTYGKKITTSTIQTYIMKFMEDEIISFFDIPKEQGHYWYLAYITENEAKALIRLSNKEKDISTELFSDKVINKLKPKFEIELNDLWYVFGKSGTCTAFMLRKVLEKLIFLVFAKNSIGHLIQKQNGHFVGLKEMINLSTANQINGSPILMPKTGKEVQGIKFLGDSSAHNPLTNVDMRSIIPQMPYIITAFEELAEKL